MRAKPGAHDKDGVPDGVGIEIGVTHQNMDADVEADGGRDAVPEVHVASNGFVGFGVSSPMERVDVNGNVRVAGDILAGPTGTVNLVEMVLELKNDVRKLKAESKQATRHPEFQAMPNCQAIFNGETAAGRAPESDWYKIKPASDSSTQYLVWCEMRDNGGFIRVGRNDTEFNWVGRDEGNEDVTLVPDYELEMLCAVSSSQGGFSEFYASCDLRIFMMADSSANDHTIVYRNISYIMKGGAATEPGTCPIWTDVRVVQGHGGDKTKLYNRGGESCSNPVKSENLNVLYDKRHGWSGCLSEYSSPSACTAVFCTADWEKEGSCGKRNMPSMSTATTGVLLTSLEFRPRTQFAHQDEWHRNQYSLEGQELFVYFK
jgi:hypothetical protein